MTKEKPLSELRDELADKYATGNNTVSYLDISDACAFAEGFDAAVAHYEEREKILVEALEFYALAPRDLFNEAMLKHHENIEAGTKAREALKKVMDGE